MGKMRYISVMLNTILALFLEDNQGHIDALLDLDFWRNGVKKEVAKKLHLNMYATTKRKWTILPPYHELGDAAFQGIRKFDNESIQ